MATGGRPRSAASKPARRASMLPCAAASFAMFLIGMDTFIVNVALPTIGTELHANMAAQQWIIDGNTLAFAALLLLAGNLSDRFGAKHAFMAGTAGFAVSSLICALAVGAGMLVLGRTLLGVSAALLLPSSMSVIREAYPREADRSRALAIWGIGGSSAAAVGPILGGALAPIHWSLVFSINIPFCLAILALCLRLAPSPASARPFDVPGQVLAAAGLTGLIGGIIEGGSRGFTAPAPAALIVFGTIALAAFAFSQMRVRYPMVPPALFRKLGMRAAVFGGFAMILSWNGAIFLSTLILQQSAGLDPLASGLVFLPSAITCSITNMLSDRLSGVWSTRRILVVGIAILSAGYAVFLMLGGQLSAVGVAVAIAVAGSGGGLMTPTFAGMVLRYSEPSQAGIASAVFNTLRQVGGAVGVALFGALASSWRTRRRASWPLSPSPSRL